MMIVMLVHLLFPVCGSALRQFFQAFRRDQNLVESEQLLGVHVGRGRER